MAKRKAKRPARRSAKKKIIAVNSKMDFRTIANPAAWHADGHGDAPPYHDTHGDGGTYYDHPDSEHNDVHIDEGGEIAKFRGDPVELVSISIERLQKVMIKFERTYRKRLTTIEARLAAVEIWAKRG
jgi:hypothetical protein